MGKINTIFNPMPGQETGLILILHQNTIFQRRSYTPFWTTLPGHIPYLWKPQHGAYRQQALRNQPGATKLNSPERTEAGGGEEETPGAVGASVGREAGARRGEGSGGQV